MTRIAILTSGPTYDCSVAVILAFVEVSSTAAKTLAGVPGSWGNLMFMPKSISVSPGSDATWRSSW